MTDDVFSFSESLSSLQWRLKPVDEELASELRVCYDLPDIVARIMASRGLDISSAKNFLQATFKNSCPDPSELRDMDNAVEKVAQFIYDGKKITQFSDYDADGATAAAIIHLFFRQIGIKTDVVIPSRELGYGPNEEDFNKIINNGTKLVIVTDCGTTAGQVLNRVTDSGVGVVIIDHHEPDAGNAPDAAVLINPKRFDEPVSNPFRNMAAVGLAFMFLVALNRKLRQDGFYNMTRKEPNLLSLMDIIALGTVCDVVSLTGINRLIVKYGLRTLASGKNIGIKALAKVAGINQPLSVYHLGFVLGPRINAGGRIGQSDLAVKLLCSSSQEEAENLASQMCDVNEERKQIEEFVLKQAVYQADKKENQGDVLVFVYGENWHSGVVGIVAGRLKERYHLPVVVLSIDGDKAHASCRSVHGVDIGAAVVDGVNSGVLMTGGGHTMAAGFTVKKDNLEKAEDFLRQHIKNQLTVKGQGNLSKVLEIDALLDIGALNDNLWDKLSLLEPFGEGNAEPLFALKNVQVHFLGIRGQGHVSCVVKGPLGGSIKAMAFKAVDTELGNKIIKSSGEPFYLAGYLRQNIWQGVKSLQFVIIDAAKS